MWLHQKTNSKTFYIGEQVTTTLSPEVSIKEIVLKTAVIWGVFPQVSHHPPVSAFYVSNRKDGFCLSGSILAKSKFYGIGTCIDESFTALKVAASQWHNLSPDCWLSPRKLPVCHIRRRGAPHLSQPRRGLCDEHALRSLQRSACPARAHPVHSQAALTSPCAFF